MHVAALVASGMRCAFARQAHSAHNLTNLATEEFHSLHTVQTESIAGAVEVRAVRSPEEGVSLPDEFVEQLRAEQQLGAAAQVYRAHVEMHGSLLDVFG